MVEKKHNNISFDVQLKLEVEDYDGNKEYFSKSLSLPFVPYIGLQILLEDCKSGNPTDPISSVMWNEWSNIFVCNVNWRYSPDTRDDGMILTLESHIAMALSDGWEQV